MKITNIMMVIMMLSVMILPTIVEAQANPVIRLSISSYEPMPVRPGEFVDVWISVQNIGSGDARNIRIEYLDSPYFEIVNPQDRVREINVLGSYNDYSLKYRFRVADDMVEGENQLQFQYSLGNQPGVISTANVNLDVRSSEVPISISSVRITPDPVEPGKRTELVIALTNPSQSSNLRDVSVTLQLVDGQAGQIFELPFSPVDSTNKKSINRILPGQTTEFRFNLITHPDANSQIYKMPVLFTYYDDTGKQYDQTSFISINVNSEPDLYAAIEAITINSNARSGEVIFDIINQGVSNIKLLTVTINETENLEIMSPSNKVYLGNIESDDFKSARFRINVATEAEEVTFPLTLQYRDSLNNEFEETIFITHKLRAPENTGNNTGTIIFVLLIIAIIGFIIYRRRQKRRKSLNEDD